MELDTFEAPTSAEPPGSLALLLGRLEGKLDLLLITRRETDIRLSSLETRVRTLEAWRAYIVGISASLGVATSYVIHKLGLTP